MPPRSRNLHSVPASDSAETEASPPADPPKTPAKPRTKTVIAAAADGDELELLVAMRSVAARRVQSPKTAARDLAPLMRQLREITKEIDALKAADQTNGLTRAASTPDEPWDSEAI